MRQAVNIAPVSYMHPHPHQVVFSTRVSVPPVQSNPNALVGLACMCILQACLTSLSLCLSSLYQAYHTDVFHNCILILSLPLTISTKLGWWHDRGLPQRSSTAHAWSSSSRRPSSLRCPSRHPRWSTSPSTARPTTTTGYSNRGSRSVRLHRR